MVKSSKKLLKSIEYNSSSINDFKVVEKDGKGRVSAMSIDGVAVVPTARFWGSLCSTYSSYGLSTKLFKLFTHEEVFQRVADIAGGDGKDRLRFAVENWGDGSTPKLLAVTNPNKPVIEYDRMGSVLGGRNTEKSEYQMGIIRSTHAPPNMDDFQIAGDGFSHQYVMETPIDGYGKPLIYLSLLRQICTNGMIGFARTFRSEINIGRGGQALDDIMFSVTRALDSFNNEEGYSALRERFKSATESWASVYEVNQVLKVINNLASSGSLKDPSVPHGGVVDHLASKRAIRLGVDLSADLGGAVDQNPTNVKIMRAFTQMVGPLCEIYGITHMDAVSQKKMAKIPSKCTMYDLLNYTTEVATHYCSERNGRMLQAKVGDFVSNEFDLEGTVKTHPNFQDFFTDLSMDTDAMQN